jgi:hypothetical protein
VWRGDPDHPPCAVLQVTSLTVPTAGQDWYRASMSTHLTTTRGNPQASGSRPMSVPMCTPPMHHARIPLSAYAPPTTPPTHGLVRPWSQSFFRPASRSSGIRGYVVGLIAGALFTGLAAVGSSADASPAEPVSPAASQLAFAGDPACGFDVYRGELSVTSLSARGDVHVWLRGRDLEVRKVRPIRKGQTLVWRLKRRHSSADFQVAVSAVGRRHDDEQLWWCESA